MDPVNDIFDQGDLAGFVTKESLSSVLTGQIPDANPLLSWTNQESKQKSEMKSDINAIRNSLERIYEMSTESVGLDVAAFMSDDEYRESIKKAMPHMY